MSEDYNNLKNAIDKKDPDVLESALNDAFMKGLSSDLIPLLIDLLSMGRHFRHEDVVSALQELKPPEAVAALQKTALVTYEYLDYDEFYGLARKFTWAIADIGTLEAKKALFELAKPYNEIISGYAQKRLDNWEQEMKRKGA